MKKLTHQDLSMFTGSDTFHKWSVLSKSVLTQGAKYVADNAGAYWLFDELDLSLKNTGEHFASIEIFVDQESRTYIRIDNGDGEQIACKKLNFSDFPLDQFKLWAVHNGTAYTFMLPSEY